MIRGPVEGFTPGRNRPDLFSADLTAEACVYAGIMLSTGTALRTAWSEALHELGVSNQGSVILGGPLAERFGASIPFTTVDEVSGLVSLGDGPSLEPDSTVVASGLPDGSVDAVVMVDAWRTHDELRSVVNEAKRILRPGGNAWLASLSIEGLVNATPSVRTSALFYAVGGAVSPRVEARNEVFASTEMALMRAGFRSMQTWPMDLPVAAFDTIDEYVRAVRDGMWPGVEELEILQSEELGLEIRRFLAGVQAPIVDHEPWLLATGLKPV